MSQVCPGGVKLLSGSTRVQHLSVRDLGMQGRITITAASVADPHLLLHMSDGRAILLTADPSEGMPQHPPSHAEVALVSPLLESFAAGPALRRESLHELLQFIWPQSSCCVWQALLHSRVDWLLPADIC